MTIAIGTLLALLGIALIVIGFGMFMAFRLALRVFDHSLKSEVAASGREQIERAAMKIKNPLVRRFVLQHVVETGGGITVSLVRGAMQSRMRTGAWIAVAGFAMVLGAFFTGRWMPLIWPGSAG